MSDLHSPRLLALGDSAWTIEFGSKIDPKVHSRVLGFCTALHEHSKISKNILEYLPSFRSVSVYFDSEKVDGNVLGSELLSLAKHSGSQVSEGRKLFIPVCFEDELGPDLKGSCSIKKFRC